MSSAAAEFWQQTERHHDIAKTFEQNVEMTHPDFVTNHCPFCHRCIWCATTVIYPEYRGPSI